MKNIKSFSFYRVILLMRKTFYENGKNAFTGLIAFFGILSFVLFISYLNTGEAWINMQSYYFAGLFLVGLFISGTAFVNFRNKEKTMYYLMLPASALEKFISELILTTVGFFILYTAVFYVFNFSVAALGNLFGQETEIINIFSAEIFDAFGYYIIIQSIFLAGTATFKKIPLFLTVSSLFLFGIAIAFYTILLVLILKSKYDFSEFVNLGNTNLQMNTLNINLQDHWLKTTQKIMIKYVTAPVFWVYTYFKIKEKEV